MAKKHWIYIKRGLSEDPKHRAGMGECIWLFMHIIDRADWETGIAFDWKDKEEAEEMCISMDTLRYQRQKLEKLDYIRCFQKQHGQDIYIMEWKNPRDYGSETKNPRNQGSNELPPSNSQGSNQGSNQDGNQVPSQIKTPTYNSKSKIIDQSSLDFKNMSVSDARKVPTLKMYCDATDFFPGSILWETVHETIVQNNITEVKLRAVAVAWAGRGFKLSNVQGILDWAVNGIPSNGHKSVGSEQKPAIDEKSVERTVADLVEKWSFTPSPPPSERPRIGKPRDRGK